MNEDEAANYSYYFTEKKKEVPLLDFNSYERACVPILHYYEKLYYGRTVEHCDWSKELNLS